MPGNYDRNYVTLTFFALYHIISALLLCSLLSTLLVYQMLRNKQYYKVCRRGWHLHTDTNTYTHTYIYGMVQLQGNEYARVTHEKLACISRVHTRVLAC